MIKRVLLTIALLLAPSLATAQCNGVFQNGTVCGNATGTPNLPRPTSPSAFQGSAGGTNGQIQYNNSGALGGFTMSQDCTTNTTTGAITCTRTNNVPFGPFATSTDAKNNIANFNSGIGASGSTFWAGDGTWKTAGSGISLTSPPYSAACNGTTDDSTAIQAWLDAIPTLGPGTIPPGKTCIHTAILYVKSGTVINGNFSTIKAANGASNATTGIHLTDATWAGTGPSNVDISNLVYDGNRANRPGALPGQAAGIYIINASNIILRNVKGMNCVSDCFYAGQAAAGSSSTNITWDHVISVNAYRNGGSIVGVQQMSVIGSSFSGTNGISPESGLDVEPDNASAGLNSGVFISNSSFDGNAQNGMNVHCVINAQCNLRSGGNNLTASSNGGYGFLAAATSTNFRWCNINGVGNTSGLQTGVTDKCPP